MIRPANHDDAAAIARIYNHFVQSSTITFEEEAVDAAEMARRIADVSARLPWLVEERQGRVVGYAYATPWRVRSAYRFSVETTVYVDQALAGQGIGRGLYGALLAGLRERGLEVAIGGIALPNQASIALHERMGFEKVAHFKRVGRKFGQWVDVGYWELQLGAAQPG